MYMKTIRGQSLLAGLVVALGGLALLWAVPSTARADEKKEEVRHPLHRALEELREAKKDLEIADHDFGGHRKEALEATDHAIKHLERLLGWVKEHKKEELKKEFKEEKREDKKGEKHPRILGAIHELRQAHKYVKESEWEFGDSKQKEEALKSIDHAIKQLEKALEFDK
jgi:hypothetical protein